jgi:glutaminase
VDATGMRFNSIVAVELQRGKEINPLVNPGAIASSSMINGSDSQLNGKTYLMYIVPSPGDNFRLTGLCM